MRFYNKAFKGFKRKYIRTLKIENKKNKTKRRRRKLIYYSTSIFVTDIWAWRGDFLSHILAHIVCRIKSSNTLVFFPFFCFFLCFVRNSVTQNWALIFVKSERSIMHHLFSYSSRLFGFIALIKWSHSETLNQTPLNKNYSSLPPPTLTTPCPALFCPPPLFFAQAPPPPSPPIPPPPTHHHKEANEIIANWVLIHIYMSASNLNHRTELLSSLVTLWCLVTGCTLDWLPNVVW